MIDAILKEIELQKNYLADKNLETIYFGGGTPSLLDERDLNLFFEKIIFYPKAFTYLGKIAKELDFELVMVTNQDGLGTPSMPEEDFWPVQNFVVQCFENEGVKFEKIFIDKTFAKENAPTRKPNTGLLTEYFSDEYDLENSFVIGDRLTDIELAKNLGAKGIFINDETNLGTGEITVKRNELDAL